MTDVTRIRVPLPDDGGMQNTVSIVLERDGVLAEDGRTLLDFITRHLTDDAHRALFGSLTRKDSHDQARLE